MFGFTLATCTQAWMLACQPTNTEFSRTEIQSELIHAYVKVCLLLLAFDMYMCNFGVYYTTQLLLDRSSCFRQQHVMCITVFLHVNDV